MLAGLEGIESIASLARENPDSDRVTRELKACAHFLELYRPPKYEMYVPSKVLKDHCAKKTSIPRGTLQVESTRECVGDIALVVACLAVLVESVELEQDSSLIMEVFEENETPSVALSFDGFGRFPEPLPIGGILSISLEELGSRWTLATRGGRLDPAPNGLVLRLKGVRLPVEQREKWEPLRLACLEAAKKPSMDKIDKVLALSAPLESSPQPADLNALITDVLREQHVVLQAQGIGTELLSETVLPPIPMYRNTIRRFIERTCQLAGAVLPQGGSLAVMTGYEIANRQVSIDMSIEGTQVQSMDDYLLASMRRAVTIVHDGIIEVVEAKRSMTIFILIPDTLGCALDTWIPGFEVFSERSKQVLRLLRTPGNPMPEELFLAGVLDEELTQWLLPNLLTPITLNLSHDLVADVAGLDGGNKSRQEKALEQVRRGKPRKEIAKPPYAGELLYAFRKDQRHREAVGCGALVETLFLRLCKLLTQSSPVALDCLRLIAVARRVSL